MNDNSYSGLTKAQLGEIYEGEMRLHEMTKVKLSAVTIERDRFSRDCARLRDERDVEIKRSERAEAFVDEMLKAYDAPKYSGPSDTAVAVKGADGCTSPPVARSQVNSDDTAEIRARLAFANRVVEKARHLLSLRRVYDTNLTPMANEWARKPFDWLADAVREYDAETKDSPCNMQAHGAHSSREPSGLGDEPGGGEASETVEAKASMIGLRPSAAISWDDLARAKLAAWEPAIRGALRELDMYRDMRTAEDDLRNAQTAAESALDAIPQEMRPEANK